MEPQTRTDPSWRKLRSYSGMANTQRKHTLQSPTSDGRPSSLDIRGSPITTRKLTGLDRVSPCLDALPSVEDCQTEAWRRMMDQNLEMRFTPCSSPLSGQNTTLGLQVPHHSGWPRKRRRLRLASLSRTWCQCRQDISLISNPPIGMTFGLQSIHSHYGPRMQPLECFFVQISRNPFSKSGQNCDEVIPLNRANSGDLNSVIPTFIPILEGEIWKLPCFCLPALPGWCR